MSDTRTRIMDAAEDLLQRVGANGMSYADLSQIVGIRKASIHHHFPSKDDLIETVLDRYAKRIVAGFDEILASDVDAPTKLRQMFEFDETYLQAEHACLYGMLGAEMASLQDFSVKQISDFFAQMEKRLRALIEQGIAEGTFHFEGDTKALADVIFCFVQGALIMGRVRGGARMFRAASEQLLVLLRVEN